ncbi:ricin-type beta-trefoil lectin domain protein [Kitasatospora sp. NPDC093679]|uniref:RICIN domain-containing protein n=1 Tax=Kitasatospora sp. NPDC093679 TaxID=3154983 RepID=UPI00343378F1
MRVPTPARLLLPALSAALAVPLLTAAPAAAAAPAGFGAVVQFKSAKFGMCIYDTPGGGNNYRLQDCHEDDLRQQFAREVLGDGSVVYKGVASGQCLDNNGTAAYAHDCNTSGYQHWWEKNKAGPVITLQNQQTLQCLDTDGDYVYVHDCGELTNPNQRWQIVTLVS